MWQNFFHRQQRIAEGITEFLGNLLKTALSLPLQQQVVLVQLQLTPVLQVAPSQQHFSRVLEPSLLILPLIV